MKVASLFTGVGGFDLGFEQAGHEVVYQCENDPKAQEILRKHWPNIHLETDVKNAKGNILQELGTQIITAGFPCQNISIAGNREGLHGDKSRLFFEILRIIKEAKNIPYIVLENVPNLIFSNKKRDMETVIKSLEICGYQVEYRILDSQYFRSTPQRRRRVFIVGRYTTGQFGSGSQILFESEGLHRDSTQGEETGERTTTDTGSISDRGSKKLFRGLGFSSYKEDELSAPLRASQAKQADTDLVLARCTGFAKYKLEDDMKASSTIRARHNESTDLVVPRIFQQNQNYVHQDVCSTLNASGAGTSRPGGQGAELGFYVCNPPRRLTPIETERLQGFPDNFTEGVADTHRYRFMGNAVTVPVAKWIGQQIQRYEATNE